MNKVSTDTFELPFMMNKGGERASDGDENEDSDLEYFENQLPSDAVFLGLIDTSVDNWTSWKLEDHYYIVPITDDDYKWALVRISWDDNWGRYDWSGDARIKSLVDPNDAALAMIHALLKQWDIDLTEADNQIFAEFLASLK